ncbi:MAG: aryl-sulfate sulfotransferase [Deltaproteobacteria bacterium]|nr:aryl-sulfate sulfotransferase [Deltaproteobacteria bacterium]MBW2136326.1 aryl-sulfate sulfotransferase [Deltaproteobacteria bacterium]
MVWPVTHPVGTTYYDPERAFNGYTIWAPLASDGEVKEESGVINLMDMAGRILHTWRTAFPVHYGRLLPNGNMFAMLRRVSEGSPLAEGYHMGGAGGLIVEYNWEGDVLFEWDDPCSHHDMAKLANGNYIYVGWEKIPRDMAPRVRGGLPGTEHHDGTIFSDYFREIDPEGNILWEWHAFEHLDPDIDVISPFHARNEWSHINNIDIMPDGNVLSSSRHMDSAFIVEKDTGSILWRWGNVAYYDRDKGQVLLGNVKDPRTMGGPHAAHVIPEGLPGAGHMLVYDNGMYVYGSRAIEVDIKTGEILWQTEDHGPVPYVYGRNHFSPFISNAQRLANGNTLLCEGQNGVFMEITREQELVWQYVRPTPSAGKRIMWGVFRAYRYAPDYCPQFASLPPAEGEAILPDVPHGITW